MNDTPLRLVRFLDEVACLLFTKTGDSRAPSAADSLSQDHVGEEKDCIDLAMLTISWPGIQVACIDLCITFTAPAEWRGHLEPMLGRDDFAERVCGVVSLLAYRRMMGKGHPEAADFVSEVMQEEARRLFKSFADKCLLSALTEHLNRAEGRTLNNEEGAPRGYTLPDRCGSFTRITEAIKPLISLNHQLALVTALHEVSMENLAMALAQAVRLTTGHYRVFWRTDEYAYMLRFFVRAFEGPSQPTRDRHP